MLLRGFCQYRQTDFAITQLYKKLCRERMAWKRSLLLFYRKHMNPKLFPAKMQNLKIAIQNNGGHREKFPSLRYRNSGQRTGTGTVILADTDHGCSPVWNVFTQFVPLFQIQNLQLEFIFSLLLIQFIEQRRHKDQPN